MLEVSEICERSGQAGDTDSNKHEVPSTTGLTSESRMLDHVTSLIDFTIPMHAGVPLGQSRKEELGR